MTELHNNRLDRALHYSETNKYTRSHTIRYDFKETINYKTIVFKRAYDSRFKVEPTRINRLVNFIKKLLLGG